MAYVIRFRRGTADNWTLSNPVLALGEPGWERDTYKLKIGDGVTPWASLPYFAAGSGSSEDLIEHIIDETPHPEYDDAPSFALLYENAKV